VGLKQAFTSLWTGAKRPFVNAWRGIRWLWSPEIGVPDSSKRDYEDLRKVNSALLPLLALGLIAAIWVGAVAHSTGPVLLWCMSCLAVGAMAGFLFGIPRTGSLPPKSAETKETNDTSPTARSKAKDVEAGRPNTNLEEVSDWLTKIIVGLSLVHLKTIEERVMSISRNAAAAINVKPTDTDVSAATALVVGLSVIGFLCGYLYTRLFLQGAFMRSDSDTFRNVLRDEQKRMGPTDEPVGGQPVMPSSSDRQAAERVLQAAPADRPEAVLAPLRALAAEYEQVRKDMPQFSRERTRKMSEIVSRMKPLTLAAKPYLSLLANSHSPGERLAAVLILQMDFDPAYIEWLADRLHVESAFIGYQATSGLLARVRVSGPPEKLRIKTAIEATQAKGIQPESERDQLVTKILEEASR